MKKNILLLLTVSLFTWFCSTSKKALAFNPGTGSAAAPDSTIMIAAITPATTAIKSKFRRPVRDKQLYAATPDMVFPDTVYITRDTLHILTKKVQVCDAESFKLIWNGIFLKSAPPQAIVKIIQVVDPACKKQNTFHLMYNLTPLRYKQDSIHVDKVIIKVRDYAHALPYEY